MKYLKIEDGKALFLNAKDKLVELDKITKEDILFMIDRAIADEEFEMDSQEEQELHNKAHQIIYKHLHEKFSDLINNREIFKNESDKLYKEASDKYSRE